MGARSPYRYLLGMITSEQARIVRDQIGKHRAYYRKLKARLEANGYDHRSPLLLKVVSVSDALEAAWMDLHYTSGLDGRRPPDNTMAR